MRKLPVNGALFGVPSGPFGFGYGLSSVWVEFDWDTDPILPDTGCWRKLSEIEGAFTHGWREADAWPQSSMLGEIMIIGLTADSITSAEALPNFADGRIRPELLSLSGVSCCTSVLIGER